MPQIHSLTDSHGHRAGLQERYIRERPGALVTAGIVRFDPFAPWLYGVSTLHCLTVSLAQGGSWLGAVYVARKGPRSVTPAADLAELTEQ